MIVPNNTRMLLTDSGVMYTLRQYGRLPLLLDGSGRVLTAIAPDGSLRLPDAATIDRLVEKGRLQVVMAGGPDLCRRGNGGMTVIHRLLGRDEAIDERQPPVRAELCRSEAQAKTDGERLEMSDAAMNAAAVTVLTHPGRSMTSAHRTYVDEVSQLSHAGDGDGIGPTDLPTFRHRVKVVGEVLGQIAPHRLLARDESSPTIH